MIGKIAACFLLLQLLASPGAWGSNDFEETIAKDDLILDYKPGLDAFNCVGQTTLPLATRSGHGDRGRRLLEVGANPNASAEEYTLPPLMGSVIGKNLEITKFLIEAGAYIDHQEVINKANALHWTWCYEKQEAARNLLRVGADDPAKILVGTLDFRSLAKAMKQTEWVQQVNEYEKNVERIKGSWVIQNIQYIYTDTTYEVSTPAPGIFMVSDARYIILYHPTDRPRTPFADFSNPSCDELKQAFQHLIFNTGTYHMTDDLFVAKPDIARVPGFEGAQQRYRYKLDGDVLSLTMFDETYPNGKKPEWYGKLQIQLQFKRE